MKFTTVTEHKGSFLYSQKHVNGTWPEPAQSFPQLHKLLLTNRL